MRETPKALKIDLKIYFNYKIMICNKCLKELSNDKFELRSDTHKLRNTCKICRIAYVKKYKYEISHNIITKRKPPDIINNKKKLC